MRSSSASLLNAPSSLTAGSWPSSRGSSCTSPLIIAGSSTARAGCNNVWCPFASSLFSWKTSPFVPFPGSEHSMSREKGKQAPFAGNYPAGLGFLWRRPASQDRSVQHMGLTTPPSPVLHRGLPVGVRPANERVPLGEVMDFLGSAFLGSLHGQGLCGSLLPTNSPPSCAMHLNHLPFPEVFLLFSRGCGQSSAGRERRHLSGRK